MLTLILSLTHSLCTKPNPNPYPNPYHSLSRWLHIRSDSITSYITTSIMCARVTINGGCASIVSTGNWQHAALCICTTRFVVCLFGCLLIGCLLARLVGWLVGWLFACAVGCLVVGLFVCLFVCSFAVCLFVCLFAWFVFLFAWFLILLSTR